MRVLVTGAAGFIGSHVVDKLCDYGVGVRAFDLAPPGHREDLEFFPGSILELDQLAVAMTRCGRRRSSCSSRQCKRFLRPSESFRDGRVARHRQCARGDETRGAQADRFREHGVGLRGCPRG